MDASLSAVMLVVSELPRAVAFYEALGFRKDKGGGALASMSSGSGSSAIALMARKAASTILGAEPSSPAAAPPVILVHMAKDRAEVDAWLEAATKAGGRVLKAAADNEWGGYQCAFADPDGHAWSVGFNLDLYRA